jgi:hypothetical protein
MTDEQKAAYEQLLKKRSVTLKKTTNDQAKKLVFCFNYLLECTTELY